MPFTVTTYNSEDDLAAAITAVVTTYNSEDAFDDGIAAATTPAQFLAHGGKFTLIDNPQIVNVSLRVLAKGGKFTVVLETA